MQVWHTISTLTALHCLWFHTYVIRVCSNSALEHTILPESLWSTLFPLVKWINCNSFEIPFPCNTHSSSQPFTGIHLLHAAFALRLKTIPHHELAESSRNDFLPCQHLIVLYFQQIILSCDGPKQTFFEEGIPKEVYAGDQVSLLLPLSWPSSDLWSIRQLRAAWRARRGGPQGPERSQGSTWVEAEQKEVEEVKQDIDYNSAHLEGKVQMKHDPTPVKLLVRFVINISCLMYIVCIVWPNICACYMKHFKDRRDTLCIKIWNYF